MMTIKNIIPSGEEFVYQVAGYVNFVPGAAKATTMTALTAEPDSLWFDEATPIGTPSGPRELTCGAVYVMNNTGATVAKYDLGGWPSPEVVDPDPLNKLRAA